MVISEAYILGLIVGFALGIIITGFILSRSSK